MSPKSGCQSGEASRATSHPEEIVFGPVPSRRFGQSLGINNIPPKGCTYSCVYCQVGVTERYVTERQRFFAPEMIEAAVARRLDELSARSCGVDYLSFVPTGEPTIDANLGESIVRLRRFGVPIAVITNGSLLWRQDVRSELSHADVVSVKVDTVDQAAWRRINRPDPRLRFEDLQEGKHEFGSRYEGRLLTETMLVDSLNTDPDGLVATAQFIAKIEPAVAYLAVPTRPPALPDVSAPREDVVLRAYESFKNWLSTVELLAGYEDGSFAPSDDLARALLATVSVHPMRREEVQKQLELAGADMSVADALVASGDLAIIHHRGYAFYVRPFGRAASPTE